MWSVSRVECYEKCPYQYRLRYLDGVGVLDDYEADNPLTCGTALHEVIELGAEKAARNYFSKFPVVTDEQVTEMMKIEVLGRRAKALLPKGEYEHKVAFYGFVGFIDLMVRREGRKVDIYDFKHCGKMSREKYITESPQLHAYKYYLESVEDVEVEHLYYVFVPKVQEERRQDEDIIDYRYRLMDFCREAKIDIVEIPYQAKKVGKLVEGRKAMESAKEFPKVQSALCNWCDYQDYCYKGEDWMILPKAERKANPKKGFLKVWLYGAPYSGKTYMADKCPMPLLLNTDGNVRETTAPCIAIRDEVKMNGKAKQVKMAWSVFKEAVEELEKGSEFRTIVVDLVEDVYESCRLYMYDKLGITHESDDSFRAWDKVRLEFLSTMRRLTNLDCNIVLISQEDVSRDITKKGGDRMSTVQPVLNDKIARKISGMVDVTARCVHDEKGYWIVFHTDETQFGGGRMEVKQNVVPATIENLMGACQMKYEGDAEPIQAIEGQWNELKVEDSKTVAKEPETVAEVPRGVAKEPIPAPEPPAKVVEDIPQPITRRVRRPRSND